MDDLNALPLDELYRHLAGAGLVSRMLELARDEDLGSTAGCGDITSESCVPAQETAEARLVARQAGIVAGLAVLPDVMSTFRADIELELHASDGEHITAGLLLATLRGRKRDILTVERVALNLVGRLSGIATLTSRFALAAAGDGAGSTRARIYDTRKTTPGLRMLEKYAVRCGGGYCHRLGLHDAVLIKDNHLAGVALESLDEFIADAAARARAAHPDLQFIEVEVDSLDQFRRLTRLPAGLIDIILLDNMTAEQLHEAARLRDAAAPGLQLEASGGIRLENVRTIAETGVDRISVGALTHSATALDVALDISGATGGAAA